jgi:hypothetical protein
MWSRLTLPSSCFCFLSAGMTGMPHHAKLLLHSLFIFHSFVPKSVFSSYLPVCPFIHSFNYYINKAFIHHSFIDVYRARPLCWAQCLVKTLVKCQFWWEGHVDRECEQLCHHLRAGFHKEERRVGFIKAK